MFGFWEIEENCKGNKIKKITSLKTINCVCMVFQINLKSINFIKGSKSLEKVRKLIYNQGFLNLLDSY